MEPGAPSPFLEVPEAEWVCANGLAFAIFDSFPVSPGHVLVITRRVVPTFFECTAAEQQSLMALVGEVKAVLDERLDPKPDGYNVGFNAGAAAGQTVPHVHVHVIPRYSGDMGDPRGGVRHVIPEKGNYLENWDGSGFPRGDRDGSRVRLRSGSSKANPLPSPFSLTIGPDRPLWPRLAERLPGASEIDLLASFVQPSGLDIIRAGLFSAIAAGARVRLLVGDYLGITSPEALRQLLGWNDLAGGAFKARLVEMENLRDAPDSFHPKAWRIADSSGGIVVVGSSNLSRSALVSGVEWNLVGETSGSDELDRELATAFDDLWQQATPLSAEVVERYAARAAEAAELREKGASHLLPVAEGDTAPAEGRGLETKGGWHLFPPRPWQQEALASLAAIRRDGYQKALVAVATGLGKTWLAAFDVIAVGRELGRPPRVLVIAHRAEILAQAEATLRQAIAPASVSYVAGASCDLSGQLVIASIQKLSRPDSVAALAAAAPFDYCVIDEVHHAEAPSYRRVLARLSELSRAAPSFTLGLTATPERTDGVDVATLFDDILAAQATIGDGIAEGSLVPFRYRGLKDDVDFGQIPWRNGRFDPAVLEAALENAPRMERLWAEWQIGDGSGFPLGKSAPVPDLRLDLLLAHYTRSRLSSQTAPRGSEGTPLSTTFRAKVSHSSGKPILFLPTVESVPSRPTGPTRVRLPHGREWVFQFVKVACNVAHPVDAVSARGNNALPALLREWFGPDAGLPGTNYEVEFTSVDGQWFAAPQSGGRFSNLPNPPSTSIDSAPPLPLLPSPPPAARYTTHVPVYDLTAAAGFWGPE